MLLGTRGSPKAPTRMESNSLASMAKPLAGTVVPSCRKRSALQSKCCISTGAPEAAITLTASTSTSLPMPSPGITAILLALAFTAKSVHERDLILPAASRDSRQPARTPLAHNLSVHQAPVQQVPVEQKPYEADAGQGNGRVPQPRPPPARPFPGAHQVVERSHQAHHPQPAHNLQQAHPGIELPIEGRHIVEPQDDAPPAHDEGQIQSANHAHRQAEPALATAQHEWLGVMPPRQPGDRPEHQGQQENRGTCAHYDLVHQLVFIPMRPRVDDSREIRYQPQSSGSVLLEGQPVLSVKLAVFQPPDFLPFLGLVVESLQLVHAESAVGIGGNSHLIEQPR